MEGRRQLDRRAWKRRNAIRKLNAKRESGLFGSGTYLQETRKGEEKLQQRAKELTSAAGQAA